MSELSPVCGYQPEIRITRSTGALQARPKHGPRPSLLHVVFLFNPQGEGQCYDHLIIINVNTSNVGCGGEFPKRSKFHPQHPTWNHWFLWFIFRAFSNLSMASSGTKVITTGLHSRIFPLPSLTETFLVSTSNIYLALAMCPDALYVPSSACQPLPADLSPSAVSAPGIPPLSPPLSQDGCRVGTGWPQLFLNVSFYHSAQTLKENNAEVLDLGQRYVSWDWRTFKSSCNFKRNYFKELMAAESKGKNLGFSPQTLPII